MGKIFRDMPAEEQAYDDIGRLKIRESMLKIR